MKKPGLNVYVYNISVDYDMNIEKNHIEQISGFIKQAFIMLLCFGGILARNHSFRTCAEFSEKLTFLISDYLTMHS